MVIVVIPDGDDDNVVPPIDVPVEAIARRCSPRFNFCIDFLVDSVPRNSFTTVEPRYC